MKTVCILIGNSDNKLTQAQWSAFIHTLLELGTEYGTDTHFAGGSPYSTPWQNACFVFDMRESMIPHFRGHLQRLAKSYCQNSIAMLEGVTDFVA